MSFQRFWCSKLGRKPWDLHFKFLMQVICMVSEMLLLMEEDWHFKLERSSGMGLGLWEDADTNCTFNTCFIRCVQKAVEASGKSSARPTTTSPSWAASMNGSRLQKVSLDPALPRRIILVSSPTLFPSVWCWRNWCDPDSTGNREQSRAPGHRRACQAG